MEPTSSRPEMARPAAGQRAHNSPREQSPVSTVLSGAFAAVLALALALAALELVTEVVVFAGRLLAALPAAN